MEPRMTVVFCAVAAFLGLLSAVLGFAAEATKVKASEVILDIDNNVCLFSSSPSSALGFASAFILLVGFIMVNLSSGCFCCYRRNNNQSPATPRSACNPALVCYIFSWITFLVGFILMLVGAGTGSTSNMDTPRVTAIDGVDIYTCYVVKPGVFATAACFSFISVALGITCSLNLTGAMGGGASPPDQAQGGVGIAMGQPQVPPPKQPSGFPNQQSYGQPQF